MDPKFVVFTPGRTGSHLIMGNLRQHYTQRVNIIHTHNPLFKASDEYFIGILSKRRNLFDALLSSFVGMKTNEFSSYTDKKIDTFFVPPTRFEDTWNYYKVFYDLIDRTQFLDTIEIYYEDMLADSIYLSSKLGVDGHINLKASDKSPRKSQDYILNIDELKELYLQLENTGVAEETVSIIKNTIIDDLNDIAKSHNGNRVVI